MKFLTILIWIKDYHIFAINPLLNKNPFLVFYQKIIKKKFYNLNELRLSDLYFFSSRLLKYIFDLECAKDCISIIKKRYKNENTNKETCMINYPSSVDCYYYRSLYYYFYLTFHSLIFCYKSIYIYTHTTYSTVIILMVYVRFVHFFSSFFCIYKHVEIFNDYIVPSY